MHRDDHHTETAHQAWDRQWRSAPGRATWLTPAAEVVELVPELRSIGVDTILDLGTGIGRHAIFLATQGFGVHALDASPSGLDVLRERASSARVRVHLCRGLMSYLPYGRDAFGAVIAWNVIYHGNPSVVQRTIREIHRVLRPGGLLLATMLSKHNTAYGKGREIAPDTFVIDDASDDKTEPHLYCDDGDVRRWFREFAIHSLSEVEQARPGTHHWHMTATRE